MGGGGSYLVRRALIGVSSGECSHRAATFRHHAALAKPTYRSCAHEAKQGGDKPKARDYGWVERAVWTDRMLAALEGGVKGGKWFSHRRWPNACSPASK